MHEAQLYAVSIPQGECVGCIVEYCEILTDRQTKKMIVYSLYMKKSGSVIERGEVTNNRLTP